MIYPDPRLSTTASLDHLYTHAPARRFVATFLLFLIGSVFTFRIFSPVVRADELAPAVPGSIAGVVKTRHRAR